MTTPEITPLPSLPDSVVRADQPARHDHTPAFTSRLGAGFGEVVRVRLKTTLELHEVRFLIVDTGEIEDYPAREIEAVDGEGRWFEYDLRLHARRVHYAWQIIQPDDNVHLTTAGLHHTRRPYRDWFQYLAGYVAPEWAWKSVFYQIFPDRFRNGDPTNDVRTGEYEYAGRPVQHVTWNEPPTRDLDIHGHYGGDLQGVTQALPYLTDLGVTGLWLTPIFTSPSAHRYDTTDYRHVDPHLGGDAAFDELLQEAHAAGMRVVLDGVFNHTGSENALFRKALSDPHAPERDLFTFREGGKLPYAAFFDVPTLPKIDYGSRRAVNEFLDGESSVVRQWLRRGIDGWRLDVAHMIGAGGTDDGNRDLHRLLKRAAREERPDAFVFGERFYDAEAVLDGEGEDSVMNYHGFGLPVMEWLTGEHYRGYASRVTTAEVVDLLWDAYHVLPAQVALNQFNLLDSHDIPRALSRLREDRVRLRAGLTLLMAYPGVPCIYYGTEVGLSQPERGSMPFNRATMPWDETRWDLDLRRDVRALIRARRGSVALQQGDLRFVDAGPDALAFMRTFTHADGRREQAVCAASRTGAPSPVTLHLPAGTWRDVLSDRTLSGGRVTVDAARGVLLLRE